MAGNEYMQNLDPMSPPSPTPSDSPGDPAGYARVTPSGIGTAPYSISAPQDIAGITAATTAAVSLSGAGVNEAASMGPRQRATEAFLNSPAGFGAMNITAGFPDYENTDINPGANAETPIQGHTSDFQGTTQAGVPQFTAGLGGDSLPGVPPEGGSMAAAAPDYPGTIQSGLQKYGTS